MTTKQIKGVQYQNSEMVQGSISSLSNTYVDTGISSSTDPFASKTNKYAETDAVMIQAVTKGIWVAFSIAGATAAVANTDDQHFIEAGTSQIFDVSPDERYIRLIEDAATAKSIVTELA